MLRVTVHDAPELLTFQLEGTLVGPWVEEASSCWQQTLATRVRPILRLDLTGVTRVDIAGTAFLAEAHARGAELVASGCLMRAIVAEITKAGYPNCRCR